MWGEKSCPWECGSLGCWRQVLCHTEQGPLRETYVHTLEIFNIFSLFWWLWNFMMMQRGGVFESVSWFAVFTVLAAWRLFHYRGSGKSSVLFVHSCLLLLWSHFGNSAPQVLGFLHRSSTISYLRFPSFCLSDFCSFFCEISATHSFNPSIKFLSF